MMTVVMGIYHAMALYIIGILIWLFMRERKSWERVVLYLVTIIPFLIRVLRIR